MSGDFVDKEAVCALCFRDLLAPIIEQERRRSGLPLTNKVWSIAGASASRGSGLVGVMDTLAQESGVPARRITGILSGECATVGLRIADSLFVALDRVDLLQMLDVFPRPRGKWLGPSGTHVGCRFAAASRLASVEPSLTKSAPDSGGSSTERKAA